MNMKQTLFAVIVSMLANATVASAHPSAARGVVQQRSLERGLNGARANVLKRSTGRGNDVVAGELLARLGTTLALSQRHLTEMEDARLSLTADQWTMTVSDEGNSVRFRTHTMPAPVALSEKPDDKTVESMGRAFVAETLAGNIALEPNESLVFLGSRYGYVGNEYLDGRPPSADQLAESIAVFGRIVHGELVLGGGSIVAVIFNGDRSVQGFDFDWPAYEVAQTGVELLPVDAIRVRGLLFQSTAGTDTEVRFECGYFDPGGRHRRRPEFVQAACTTAVVQKRGDVQSGAVSVVPASRRPTVDAQWTELSGVCEKHGACVDARGVTIP